MCLKATSNSVRVIKQDEKNVGYLHLWSGTHEKILEALKQALNGPLAGTDALILDLRDGFGGAWHSYLDPFFEDRTGFFVPTSIDRQGRKTENRPSLSPPIRTTPNRWWS